MSDCPKEGAASSSSAKTNQQVKNANKKRNNSHRNKKKNARQREANEAKEKAKVQCSAEEVNLKNKTQKEADRGKGSPEKPNLEKRSQEKRNLENESPEELKPEKGFAEDLHLEKYSPEESNPEKETNEESDRKKETHEKSDRKKETHAKSDRKKETHAESDRDKNSPEEPNLIKGHEESDRKQITYEGSNSIEGYEESDREKGTYEEPNSIEDYEESDRKKGTHKVPEWGKVTYEESNSIEGHEESDREKETQEEFNPVEGQEESDRDQGTHVESDQEKITREESDRKKVAQEEFNFTQGNEEEPDLDKGTQEESVIDEETPKNIKVGESICTDEEIPHVAIHMNGGKEFMDDEDFYQPLNNANISKKQEEDKSYTPTSQNSSLAQSGDMSIDDDISNSNSSRNGFQSDNKSKRKNKSKNKNKGKKRKTAPAEENYYDTSQKKEMDIKPSSSSRPNSALDAYGIAKLNIDKSRVVGRYRGIDGANNSCYMDATLFSLFYCTDIFDEALLNESNCKGRQTPLNKNIVQILKDNIVYPLRQGYYCPKDKIWTLRNAMRDLSPKICGSFMDAEEFIFLLFEKCLNINEFIYYTAGTSDFLHQIFVERDNKDYSTVQELFEKSMKTNDDLKLQSVPKPALFLEMPRSNRILIHYKGIVPSLHLNLTNVMVECAFDSSEATSENSHTNVAGNSTAVMKLEKSTIISTNSSGWFNSIKRLSRNFLNLFFCPRQTMSKLFYVIFYTPIFIYALWRPEKAIRLFDSSSADTCKSKGTLKTGQNDVESCSDDSNKKIAISPQNHMDLIAVICIRGCHYTSFVKCDGNTDPTWLFFDSMSGGGPEVEEVKDFEKWIERLEKEPENIWGLWQEMPWSIHRAITDSHICIYKPSSNPCVTVETTNEK